MLLCTVFTQYVQSSACVLPTLTFASVGFKFTTNMTNVAFSRPQFLK
jgi:hypothetical protein